MLSFRDKKATCYRPHIPRACRFHVHMKKKFVSYIAVARCVVVRKTPIPLSQNSFAL